MMKVVGEEGTSIDDFIIYMKAEFLDSVYLQQNGFDPVDAACSPERQNYIFGEIFNILIMEFHLKDKSYARTYFHELRQLFIDWNFIGWQSDEFKEQEKKIEEHLAKGQMEQASNPKQEIVENTE